MFGIVKWPESGTQIYLPLLRASSFPVKCIHSADIYDPTYFCCSDRPGSRFWIYNTNCLGEAHIKLKIETYSFTPNWFKRSLWQNKRKLLETRQIHPSDFSLSSIIALAVGWHYIVVNNMVYPQLFLSDEDQQNALRRAQQERKSFYALVGLSRLVLCLLREMPLFQSESAFLFGPVIIETVATLSRSVLVHSHSLFIKLLLSLLHRSHVLPTPTAATTNTATTVSLVYWWCRLWLLQCCFVDQLDS